MSWVEQAARVGDPVRHSSLLARYGLSVVALIGGTAAALLAVPTMGGSLALMAATVAATAGADAAGQALGRAELETDIANRVLEEDTGEKIVEGAATVFVDEGRERAAKAHPETTLDHGRHWVSWGSRTVFIENTYASRFGDHTSCGGHICFGSETVFYGGEKTPYPGVSDNPREQHPLDEEFLAISLAIGLAATARAVLTRRALTQAAAPASPAAPPAAPVRGAATAARPGRWSPGADATSRVPSSWGPARPTKKGVGVRWTDPANPGNGVRIDRGNPLNSQAYQQVDHVVVRDGGRVLGRDGLPLPGSIADHPFDAHIPLDDWLQWQSWNRP